ncbi:uncharacterized protein NPIL_130951 [Nephila pilipes]|uniref:Uncharacterized protein n=1 Tax=Nephila pilipes TaxID=299642 RepID=A0A8X6PNU8_NEPPI|nr:uncharacterized protein NPIL_130951 [Nephila pilipes]
MPGLSNNGDKNPHPSKAALPPGRAINTSLPPNRPVPPGVDQNSPPDGSDTNHPRIPQTNLTVPGSNDPAPPSLPRSPLRTIIGPPNGPTAIGRPAAQRLINNGVTTNGVHDLNGNNSDPTTVVHAVNGAPQPSRPSLPISSQQVNGRNVQPGVLANTQAPRIGIQAISVNEKDNSSKIEDAPTNGRNPKRLPQNNNDEDKVFLKTPNALRREEAKKDNAGSPTKNGIRKNDVGEKNGDAKNGKDKNGNGKNGVNNTSPIKRPLDKNGNGKNASVSNSPTKKIIRTNGTNGNNKTDEKVVPVKNPVLKSSQESPTKKNGDSKPQESSSPTRKVGNKAPLNVSPAKKLVSKSPRGSPSPPRKRIAKSPLPSPKTARKSVLNQPSPTKLLGKNSTNLTLVPGRPLPATTTLIGQEKSESKDDAKKEEAKSGEDDKQTAKTPDEKGKDKGKPSEASLIFDRLLTLCKRGDWLAVETLLNHLDGLQIPPDLTDSEMGYTPLMYSVKDNRVFVAERFLDMGMDINIKGKVSYSKAKIRGLEAVTKDWTFLDIAQKSLTNDGTVSKVGIWRKKF